MNGSTEDMASSQLQDKELLNLFKSIEQPGNDDKNMIKTLDALITKKKIQATAQSIRSKI